MFIVALAIYGQDQNLGVQCLTIAVDAKFVQDAAGNCAGVPTVKGKTLMKARADEFRSILMAKLFMARVYFNGATPLNDYTASLPY